MIDFILAGVVYLAIMFVVFFFISFVTVAIAYGTALIFRRWAPWSSTSPLPFK